MNLRRLLLILGAIGLTILIATSIGSPHKVLEAFLRVHWYVIVLIFVIQVVDYYCNARYYQAFFHISKYQVGLRRLYEAALGINFANQVVPSGGVAGTTYLTQALKPYGIPSGTSALAQLSRYIFTFLSYFIILALGFLLLFLGGNISRISVRFIVLLMMLVLSVGVILVVTFSDRRRLEATARPFIHVINSFGHKILHREQPILHPARINRFLDEFFVGYSEIMSHRHRWPTLFRWALACNVCEVATVYAVFVSFGQWPNPGVVIAGYTLAIMASVGGILINGLGVYEAGMIGTFVALGIPFALTFAIVTVYRITSMAIFLPIGAYFYRHHLKELDQLQIAREPA